MTIMRSSFFLFGGAAAVFVASNPCVMLVEAAAPSTPCTPRRRNNNKNKTMLAIGDSLCTGQLPRPPNRVFFSDKGYNTLLFNHLKETQDFTSLITICCPGDSSVEFLDGSMDVPPDDGSFCYGGQSTGPRSLPSQMDAAIQALGTGEVELITISLGANDVLPCVAGLVDPAICAVARIDTLVSNLKIILDALLNSETWWNDDECKPPQPRIVAMTPYNALLPLSLSTDVDEQSLAALSQLAGITLHTMVTQHVYEPYGVAVVDASDVFDGHNATISVHGDSSGGIPQNIKSICMYTGMCSRNESNGGTYELAAPYERDIHPTEEGYAKLADAHIAMIDELQQSSSHNTEFSRKKKSSKSSSRSRTSTIGGG